jgi:hypothetical protein
MMGSGDGMTVRFASVDEQERVRAGHAAYIEAVRCGLEEQEVLVTLALTGSDQGIRNAQLCIRPAPEMTAASLPAEAFLDWDEENGWSLGLRRDPATLAVVSPVYKGLGLLPDPEDVASWVVVLLTHPELTPSREDHPFRDHAVEDLEFEAQLARYASGT